MRFAGYARSHMSRGSKLPDIIVFVVAMAAVWVVVVAPLVKV